MRRKLRSARAIGSVILTTPPSPLITNNKSLGRIGVRTAFPHVLTSKALLVGYRHCMLLNKQLPALYWEVSRNHLWDIFLSLRFGMVKG